MKLRVPIVCLALLICFCKAGAQVINIESKRFLNDTNGFVGNINGNFSAVQNTQQILSMGINIHAQYQKNRHRFLMISDLSVINAANTDFVNSGYQHFRYNFKVTRHITLEAFVQAQYNRVLLLDERYLAGIGPRIKIIKKHHFKMYSACLYMFEHQSQDNYKLQADNNRISAYLSFNIGFNKWDFTSTTFYQPNLADFNDYRIANNSAMEIFITSKLNFKTELVLLFDTRQPVKIPNLTYQIRSGIGYKF
ncbi:MAG: DUF481 domain-containing protein [Sphingobacteriaceae bacterium]|nr:DUF481 domain-containing protein [Sphingobacteriaceae bacterium]